MATAIVALTTAKYVLLALTGPEGGYRGSGVTMPITTIDDLRDHVAVATRVELTTIPPYLFAMYSIKDQSSPAARLIAGVVAEEMLHVCLTTNLLLALGGTPDFSAGSRPTVPGTLAHHRPPLRLGLRACTKDLIRNTFMVIERPADAGALPEDDDFETLGQFYGALREGLDRLGTTEDLFVDHQPERQLANPSYYSAVDTDDDASGGLMLIRDAGDARAALDIVIHQGEGVGHQRWADPTHRELTHYAKFEQLDSGAVPVGPVWNVVDDPRVADLPESVRPVADVFNAIHELTFCTLDELFSGHGDQDVGIGQLYTLMSHGMRPTARYLVQQPVDGLRTAGPTFESVDLPGDPWSTTATLAADVAADRPALASVARRLDELASNR